MKAFNIFILIIIFTGMTYAQQSYPDYQDQWNQVSKYELERLPKSALEVVNKIYDQAKVENNAPQIVKTLLFQSKFAMLVEEDAQLKIVHNFENEIAQANFPTKPLLESVLANLYWQYFQQNRWKFYNRTKTEQQVSPDDFRTWDLNTIFKAIHTHFKRSLQDEKRLQQTPLDPFVSIIDKGFHSKTYRPTLYDFIAWQALNFYKTNETHLTKPAYKFELENSKLISDAQRFSSLELATKDTLSLQFNTLKIFQKLTDFHLNDKNLEALILLDIERLNFIDEHATFANKETLLLKTLKISRDQYKDNAVGTLYDAKLAHVLQKKGNSYHPKNKPDNQWFLKQAVAVCDRAIERFPGSRGGKLCQNLKNRILNSSVNVTAEEFIPINQNAKLLVQYKNIEKLSFKILKFDHQKQLALNKIHNDSTRLAYLEKLSVQTTWQSPLKSIGDYQNHRTEVLLPALPQGMYVVLATLPDTSTYGYAVIQVTDLTLAEIQTRYEHRMQVLNRNNGSPVTGAKVHIKSQYHSRYNKSFDQTFTTDKNGCVYLPKRKYYSNLIATVSTDNDQAIFGNYYISKYYKPKNSQKTYYQSFIFTDRSIYRPGQKVYFKAIVVERNPEGKQTHSRVLTNTSVEVILKDVNWQDVRILTLTTNAYGSVAGEFELTESGLTGPYHLQIKGKRNKISGRHNISVEEYKRPKFETNFKPVTETFKVNDNVTVKGEAKAFTGTTIADAKVVYRVHREVQYPRWWYWYYPNYISEPQEITHGETTTDAQGNYQITFKALPDQSVAIKNRPVFHYKITADVTDINGETRTAETTVNVGYHSILLTVTADNQWQTTDKTQDIVISAKNLNNENIDNKGVVKIFKLKAPEQVKRPRPWPAPDFSQWTASKFNRLFPNDVYGNNSNVYQWEQGKKVFEQSYKTTKEAVDSISIKKDFARWTSGNYQIVVTTKDKNGETIEDKTLFILNNSKVKTVADNQLLSVTADKDTYKPGEQVTLRIGSASPDATVYIYIEKNYKIVSTHTVKLHNNIKTLSIPINDKDLGGFAVKYLLVNLNTVQTGTINVKVEQSIKDLNFEVATFKDKLQPGSEQTWQFRLKGLDKDPKGAEILISMYDASLDQFKMHQWRQPNLPLYQNYWPVLNLNAQHSFGNRTFRIYDAPQPEHLAIIPFSFDKLNWFGFGFTSNMLFYSDKLDEVVVTGYGGRKKRKAMKEEAEMAVMEDADGVANALEGKVAGLNVSPGASDKIVLRGVSSLTGNNDVLIIIDGKPVTNDVYKSLNPNDVLSLNVLKGAEATALYGAKAANGVIVITTKKGQLQDLSDVKARTNFQETAFFYPQLLTDKNGNISFSFTTPEALTRWKLQLMGHTTDMQTAYHQATTVTQKDLMVQPNPPRFLREGDKIILSSKISNLSNKMLNGVAQLELTDAVTGKNIDTKLSNDTMQKDFSLDAQGNTSVSWTLHIPYDVQAVQYKIVAKAGTFSDGEQNALPVLSNRMLVTETLPMWVNSNETRTFTLDKLKNHTSPTLSNHKLTLEVTSNPVWYAIQALPYLMEYPYECSEQTFSRLYANALATKIVNDNPKIKAVFDQWKNTDALLSNLEKNEDLKSLLIAETPWLRDAQSESEQKKSIALLFDLNKISRSLNKASNKLRHMQFSDGGFPWFKGSRYPSRYITQHIVSGFGHLNKLGAWPVKGNNDRQTAQILTKAVSYMDREIMSDYQELIKQARIIRDKAKTKAEGEKKSKDYMDANHLGAMQLHYLYARTFYSDISIPKSSQTAVDYYTKQAYKFWADYRLYQKGLIALVAQRNQNTTLAQKIVHSLDENSTTNEELGMYWKANQPSWYWYQAPIETQALMIETFAEVKPDQKQLDLMKMWLLKNKQTNRWTTTKATTEAVYVLLAYGYDWTANDELVEVSIGNQNVTPKPEDAEAGTGYFKTSWMTNDITKDKAEVTLTKKDEGIAWGGLYWQYFENLDKITFAETPLAINKKLFLKKNTDTSEKLSAITDNTKLQVGDLVRVRIEIKVDRDMDYVHMKDMRASGFEPINVLSQYKYQDGLGYYESTKDASTNFFFDHLRKGVYVFEYDLRANNSGDFSNGITTIQCMYAPEFTSHSEGVRINIRK